MKQKAARAPAGEQALEGLRVMVLRPETQAGGLADLLSAEGAEPVQIPAIRIVPPEDWTPIDAALDRLDNFGWLVFTSVNGAGFFIERLRERGGPSGPIAAAVAAIGPATRQSLEEAGVSVDWMPSAYTTRALADELPEHPPGLPGPWSAAPAKVCLFRADIASSELDESLKKRGFDVERVNAYGTRPVNAGRIREALPSVDVVALTSASIVESFAAAARDNLPARVSIFSIGPATSEACRKASLPVAAEAEEHTARGLVEALKKHRGIL